VIKLNEFILRKKFRNSQSSETIRLVAAEKLTQLKLKRFWKVWKNFVLFSLNPLFDKMWVFGHGENTSTFWKISNFVVYLEDAKMFFPDCQNLSSKILPMYVVVFVVF
jgi:hypothetical protein